MIEYISADDEVSSDSGIDNSVMSVAHDHRQVLDARQATWIRNDHFTPNDIKSILVLPEGNKSVLKHRINKTAYGSPPLARDRRQTYQLKRLPR